MVGAGDPILYVTGPLFHLVDLETVLLQRLGPPCVAAHNAYSMCAALPKTAFLAMDARHCAGAEMAEMMAYAAAIGSAAARRGAGAKGFAGGAAAATARFFGRDQGLGTMPHVLVGYAGSTVRAAEMFREVFPGEKLTVLIDYFGRETTDALAVARRFPDLAASGQLAVRIDTHGGRYVEGLDPVRSSTRSSSAMRRRRRGFTAASRSCAIWSAPGYRRRRSGCCGRPSTRPASERSRSSPARASARPNAG